MKVDIVTPSIGQASGGVGSAVLDLTTNLCRSDASLSARILTIASNELVEQDNQQFISTIFKRTPPSKLGLSLSLLNNAIKTDADLVHLHGLWMATSIYPIISNIISKTPYVISPHGMLDPWILNRGKAQKNIAKFLYERYSWSNCTVFHALNILEADAIKKSIPAARIEIIPNGVIIPPYIKGTNDKKIRLLFLGRFHKKKNVHGLISAINNISLNEYNRTPFVLDLVGWGDDNYIQKLRSQIKEGFADRFNWVGPAFGEEKQRLLSNADAFILPSFSEGLPVAVLEAWANGLVVIMSEFCNLPEAFESGAALDSGVEVSSIKKSLQEYLSLSDHGRLQVSKAGYDFVAARYNWDVICSDFSNLYSMVVKGS